MKKLQFSGGLLLAAVLLGACTAPSQNHEITQAPRTQTIPDRYGEVYDYLREQIPELRTLVIAVGPIGDATKRFNYAEGGAGHFLPQRYEDMVLTSLHQAGVRTVEFNAGYRKEIADGLQLGMWKGSRGSLLQQEPHYAIKGAINRADFVPGWQIGGGGRGATASYNEHSLIVGGDFRLHAYPGPGRPGGRIFAATRKSQQFHAVELEAGLFSIVGGGAATSLIEFSFSQGDRHPVQYVMGWYIDAVVAELLLQTVETASQAGIIPDRTAAVAEARRMLRELDLTRPVPGNDDNQLALVERD